MNVESVEQQIDQLRQERGNLAARGEEILGAAEAQGRELLDETEAERVDAITREVSSLSSQVGILERAIERRRNGVPGTDGPSDPRPFARLGDQLTAVIKAGRMSARGAPELIDPRLAIVADYGSPVSGLGESVPSDGGFLLQYNFDANVLRRTYDVGEILKRVNRKPIGAGFNGLRINAIDETSRVNGARLGGVLGYWADEAGALTGSKPKFRQINMKLEKLTGLVFLTDELIRDSEALEAIVMEALPEELKFRAETAILGGSGAGQPQGILNSPAKITIPAEAGQDAGTIVWENIQNMWSRLWARSQRNAVWFYNQDCEPQLRSMGQVVGTGGVPVWLPAGASVFGAAAGTPYATLLGRPAIPVEYASSIGTEGDIMLLDLGEYLLIDKSIDAKASIHVRFLEDEMALRFIYRVNGGPAWNKPLNPFNGVNTKNPFLTLATRS